MVDGLFEKPPAGGHELVLFDINRVSEVEQVLIEDPKSSIGAIFNNPGLSFAISLVTNASEESHDIVVLQKNRVVPRFPGNPLI